MRTVQWQPVDWWNIATVGLAALVVVCLITVWLAWPHRPTNRRTP